MEQKIWYQTFSRPPRNSVSFCHTHYLSSKTQTHKRFERTLFIRTKYNMQIFRVTPLSSYRPTLKQQLNVKLWKMRWGAKPFICFCLVQCFKNSSKHCQAHSSVFFSSFFLFFSLSFLLLLVVCKSVFSIAFPPLPHTSLHLELSPSHGSQHLQASLLLLLLFIFYIAFSNSECIPT